jgi:hypothetical protein
VAPTQRGTPYAVMGEWTFQWMISVARRAEGSAFRIAASFGYGLPVAALTARGSPNSLKYATNWPWSTWTNRRKRRRVLNRR